MGKTRKKFGSLRPSPTGVSGASAGGDAELDSDSISSENTPAVITNILEKLQAPSTEERACGCKILANIVSQPSAIGHFLNQDGVKIAAPLFLDACHDVSRSALGALKNMSVFGNEDVCDVMVNQDVLTPLMAVTKQYGNNWAPPKEASKYDTETDVFVEAIELLANLCENSATAVRWFNKENLITILLPLLKVETFGFPLSIAVARCVHVVSENNSEVTSVCRQSQLIDTLVAAMSDKQPGIDNILFKTHVTGILLNLPEFDLTPHYSNIVTSTIDALDMDLADVIQSGINGQQQTEEEMKFDPELTWPSVDKLLSAQGVSLELLANLCCADDEWEDAELEGSEESADEQANNGEDDMETAENLCLSSELNSAFLEQNILAKILKTASPFHADLIKRLETSQCGKVTLTKLSQLREKALLCLANLLEAVDETFIQQSLPLAQVWTTLYSLMTADKDSASEDLQWAVSCALRAVIQRMGTLQQTCEIGETELDFLVNVAASTKNREIQINIVRIASTFGCMLVQRKQLDPLFKKIGLILLEVVSGNEDVVTVAEALDGLFDVFREDETDAVAREINLVERLKAMQPSFKAKVSSQRKKLGENTGVVMMARTNLAGFIKYKLAQR